MKSIQLLTTAKNLDTQHICDQLTLKRLAKSDALLSPGDTCRAYYFLETGALRLYYLKNDQEYTVWIAGPGEIFTNLESYLEASPSKICIRALEPSLVYTINKSDSDRLALHSNVYNSLLRRTVEKAFVSMAKNVMAFQSSEAIERYQTLEAEKDWLNKYPLKYLSSFIGITGSSLSRLRGKKR